MSERAAGHVVFVLASASSGRAGTLRRAGIEPLIRVSEVDEDALTDPYRAEPGGEVPASAAPELVTELARAKAHAVARALSGAEIAEHARRFPGRQLGGAQGGPDGNEALAVVVGCDSLLASRGRLVGKPHDPENARRRIREQSGQSVTLHTGHCVLLVRYQPGDASRATNAGCAHIAAAVEVVDEQAVAASTEVHFGHLTDAEIAAYVATGEPLGVAGAFTIDGLGGPFIDGVSGDPHSVVGISLPLLRDLCHRLGVAWPSLWTEPARL